MKVALAEWMPDMFGLANPGTTDAQNVYARQGGYVPVRDMSALSGALNAMCQGAFTGLDASDAAQTFAGDATKLYLLSAGTFSDVSHSGGYSIGSDQQWKFCQFGQYILATEISDPVQYYLLGSSSTFAPLSGLGDTPPQARYIGRVRDFVVLGNTSNALNEVYWSGFNNLTNWTAGVNQSDSQQIQDGGAVRGITSGDVGYIFMEKAINRMTYVGPPLYFQFDVLETNRGVAAPGSLIKIGTVSYFLDQDGFYAKDGDSPSVSIGVGKIDQWFLANCEPNSFEKVSSSYDPVNKLVLWSFVSTGAVNYSIPDTILIYSWTTQQWSYVKIVHEIIFPVLSSGWTLEQVGSAYPNLDTLVPVSLDSRFWMGGLQEVGIFTSAHMLASLSGSNLAASVTTADIVPVDGMRSLVTNIRPLTDAATVNALVESRERFADMVVNTSASQLTASGDIPVLSSGRFHRVQFNVPYGTIWTFINGADVDAQQDGEQ